jgi:hypothetical protein
MALGVDTSTPRDGTRRNPFQQDATRFRGDAADSVGETLAGGDNNVEAGTTAIMTEMGDQLPQITPGGSVDMTLHQVNGDGGGELTTNPSSRPLANASRPLHLYDQLGRYRRHLDRHYRHHHASRPQLPQPR